MKNGCHNRAPYKASYITQSGWREYRDQFDRPVRVPVWVDVPFRMSPDCHYDASATDKGCDGCMHAPHLREVAA